MGAAGLPRPRVVVTADDVLHGKPDGEGYASALHQLGVDAGRAAVFEDTVLGMAAARAAGVVCVVRVGSGEPVAGEAAVVADLRQVAWDGRLRLIG
jgi:sugar-phosphatase